MSPEDENSNTWYKVENSGANEGDGWDGISPKIQLQITVIVYGAYY